MLLFTFKHFIFTNSEVTKKGRKEKREGGKGKSMGRINKRQILGVRSENQASSFVHYVS